MSMKEALSILQSTGYTKASKYLLNFGGPSDIIPPSASKRLSVTCEDCFFPGRTAFTSETRKYGPSYKVPYTVNYNNEMTMTFRVGQDFYEKFMFEKWMDKIVDPKSYDIGYYDEFSHTIRISQINENLLVAKGNRTLSDEFSNIFTDIGERLKDGFLDNLGFGSDKSQAIIPIGEEPILYTAEIQNAYPISIQEIPLSHSSTDQIHRIIVTFTFYKYISLPEQTDQDVSLRVESSIINSDIALKNPEKRAVDGQVIDVFSRTASTAKTIFNRGGSILPF